jgi:signal transduction histidine kinase
MNAEDSEILARRVKELSTLVELHGALAGASGLNEILNLAVDRIRSILHFSPATTTVLLLNAQKDRLYLEAGVGIDPREMGTYVLRSTEIDASHFERLFGRREPLLIPDLAVFPGVARLLIRKDLSSFFVFPLATEEEALGLVTVGALEPCSLAPRAVHRLGDMSRTIALHVRRALLLEQARGEAENLRRVSRTKSELLASASHELKTPLTSLRGAVELLCDPEARTAPQDRSRLMDIALSNIDYLARLIDDMLDMSRLDVGAIRLRREPMRIDELVTQVLSSFAGSGREKQLALTMKAVPQPVVIRADRDGLRRVLVNLVDNAIKYTPPGGAITVSIQDDEEEVEVSVRDTGIGIAPADHQRVFEQYVRVGADPREHGAGLGLAIVKSIVEAHHGSIRVESALGEGSRFSFRLPKHP